ncbi:uncharacterized protein [Misgurnus anguillicaudatus]|uniref:uncharacterized protein isoform X2 n=1 Tax=Misgurnus anguillicaudatus TaxID=75329 RepID=UPI003CCF2E39
MAYRKEDFEDVSTNFNCQNVYRIYCTPEVLLRISSSFTAAADVYSYSIILVEIATRSDFISQEQEDSVKLDVMWHPSLPKLKAGKDNDWPDPDDYCEACYQNQLLMIFVRDAQQKPRVTPMQLFTSVTL